MKYLQHLYGCKPLYITLILAALLLTFSTVNISAQSQKICGSVEKFNQTHRWQDLPGCTDDGDDANQTGARNMMSRAKTGFRDFFQTWEKGDIDHIKWYASCTGYMNNGDHYWAADPQLAKAKPAFEEIKRKAEHYLELLPTIQNLWQRYAYAMMYIDEAKKGDMGYAQRAVDFSKDLQKALAASPRLPDDFVMPGSGTSVPASTIGEIKSKLASYLGEANKSLEDAVAIDNAKWEPYTKLLTGDRLKFFNDGYRSGSKIFGRGGKYLHTPADFDTAAVMCTRTWGHSGIFETWRVDCWTFRGDKQISGPRSMRGYGNDTPPSAFQ
jgi:hypothetical protein